MLTSPFGRTSVSRSMPSGSNDQGISLARQRFQLMFHWKISAQDIISTHLERDWSSCQSHG